MHCVHSKVILQAYDALTLQALTGYTYVVDAINALGS